MTLNYNTHNNEPYLRLPAPYRNIIITPIRLDNREDESIIVASMNDPRVASWLIGPPFPYKPEDGKSWIKSSYETCGKQLEEIRSGRVPDGCPFRCIREIMAEDDHGIIKDTMIGCIDVDRYGYSEFPQGSETRREAEEKNLALPAGSPDIVWSIGDWLAPSYHGCGIMTAVMKTVLYDWTVPRMNTRHFKVSVFVGNHGSMRVFEKLGFQSCKVVDSVPLPENRGGGICSLHILSLDLEHE
ncbi:hypothetical protein BDV24DRAFT_162455 [Aspergillus arachidicola]|uniref:N-acetyltransferase domain-containing protein n=1 Tax=Aspergillus arachidicola TaxID=656916 RepID=A0A5N6YAS7_9EURO|nr:hypothetical protein BDV24DRAFT_162455 [Aspergillus arachidicola]